MTEQNAEFRRTAKTLLAEMLEVFGTPEKVIQELRSTGRASPVDGRLNWQVC